MTGHKLWEMNREQMLLIENLSLLIRRMARRIKLRNHPNDIGLADNALEFLGRCGLGGNIARTPDTAPVADPATQPKPTEEWPATRHQQRYENAQHHRLAMNQSATQPRVEREPEDICSVRCNCIDCQIANRRRMETGA